MSERARTPRRRPAASASGRARELFETHPLLVGVLGFAGGFLLGSLLPRTPREDRLLGPLRDDLKATGLRYGEEMTAQARAYAEEAMQRQAGRRDPDGDDTGPKPQSDADRAAG